MIKFFLITFVVLTVLGVYSQIKANHGKDGTVDEPFSDKIKKKVGKPKSSLTIEKIDSMDGVTFENCLAYLFERQGYEIQTTKTSGDYGADLVLLRDNKKIVVQAKRYSSNIGVSAVQEIVSAVPMYSADEAWVVTNQYYTKNAKNLAQANGVRLLDRDNLLDML